VLVLASGQALFQIASVMVMTVGGLAGAQLAASPRWATLPIAAMFLGTALATFPASMWMARAGRRTGFIAGTLLGAAGGALAALAIHERSLLLLSAGTFLVGTYQGFAQFYRFAAGEVAMEAHRPRAISLVLAGGVVAAIVGPLLARLGGPLLSPEYVGTFLILSVVSLGATAVLAQLSPIPASGQIRPAVMPVQGRRWREIVLQPTYLVALFGAATGYGVMILAMTATPIAMIHHDHGLATAATVIQLHTLGMFVPSFFTGDLIARFSVVRVMLAGVALLLGHVLAALSGTQFMSFAGALILLGVGWNFLYVGGTTLLTRTYTANEAARAQATNDMTIFAVGLACSLGAGALLDTLGWQRLNLLLVPWLIAAGIALLWFAVRERRDAVG
jgi:MFS family permease